MPFPHPVPVVKPRGVPERPSEKKRRRRAQILATLPATQLMIRQKTKIGQATISRWCNDLVASGDAHIGAWVRSPTGGPFAAVYHAGPGQEAPCDLAPLTHAELSRRYRDRQRRVEIREKAYREAKARALVPRRDPMVAALFGPA